MLVRDFKIVMREARDLPSYLGRYPEAGLILTPFSEPEKSVFDTGAVDADALATEEYPTLRSDALKTELSKVVDPDARVEWLVKSDRNPFAGMITVGRARNNDVVLPHGTVSKMHAFFSELGEGRWLLEDRGSTNGTFVEGFRLPAHEQRELNDGAKLMFGSGVVARFLLAESLYRLCTTAVRLL